MSLGPRLTPNFSASSCAAGCSCLPLSPHLPMCRPLDQFDHHRAACPEAGCWGREGFLLSAQLPRFACAVSLSLALTHALEFCDISSSSEGCSCESPLRRRLSAEYCETSCERLTCASFAVYRLLLNLARLLCLTCRGLHALPARLSLDALSSQARQWLEVRTHHVLDLDDFINELHLSNLRGSCDFWKLLQHRILRFFDKRQRLHSHLVVDAIGASA